ncbi:MULTISPECIES: phage antirepressor N-terminal domain-containing protein [Asaia]|uniref:Antirepressor protein ant N-terminal domain-containing protein n=1 Tax=Asaia bogorensis TaxID=91915 RepID=A0A060QKQ5_9PROT|nr:MULTISPECIES: phage antirepressor N-terminal domain-containing protein [Asaia]ETC99692.1 antirepressor [Asaia sp. SF2.1]CDG39642.1 hypothetical protein ASAP_1597 [Asaia bogorensis]
MTNALTTIDFHGAKLVAIAGDRPENTLVAMKPIVESMGLDWSFQRKKLNAHPVLSKGVAVTAIPSDGGEQDGTCLSLDLLNFWLATIHPDRLKDEVRATVIRYQTECARVLFNHFFGKVIAAGDHLTRSEHGGITKAVITRALLPVTARMDAQEARLATLVERLETAMTAYDPSAGFTTDYRPMRFFVENAGVLQKGRGGLIRNMSRRCVNWLLRNDLGGSIRHSRDQERHLFHVDAVPRWMQFEGAEMIRVHMDKMTGQGTLAPKGKKGRTELSPRPFSRPKEAAS